MNATARDRRFLTGMPALVLAATGVTWGLALTVEAAGRSDLMRHDGSITSGAPLAHAFAIHLGACAAMVVP